MVFHFDHDSMDGCSLGWIWNTEKKYPKVYTVCTNQCARTNKLTRFYIHEWKFVWVMRKIPNRDWSKNTTDAWPVRCSSDGRLWTGLFEKKIKSVLTSEKETLVQTWQFVPFALTLIQGSNIRMNKWTIQLPTGPTDPSISVFQVFATFLIFVSGICAEMLTSAWWTKTSSCWCPKQRVLVRTCAANIAAFGHSVDFFSWVPVQMGTRNGWYH